MSGAQDRPIIVYGTGSTARMTGLALAAAQLPVVLADAPQAETADRETPEISKTPNGGLAKRFGLEPSGQNHAGNAGRLAKT